MKNNVTKLDDYRVSKYDRAVKKQKRDRILSRFSKFLSTADVFFKKTNSKKGKRMIEDLKDGDK